MTRVPRGCRNCQNEYVLSCPPLFTSVSLSQIISWCPPSPSPPSFPPLLGLALSSLPPTPLYDVLDYDKEAVLRSNQCINLLLLGKLDTSRTMTRQVSRLVLCFNSLSVHPAPILPPLLFGPAVLFSSDQYLSCTADTSPSPRRSSGPFSTS